MSRWTLRPTIAAISCLQAPRTDISPPTESAAEQRELYRPPAPKVCFSGHSRCMPFGGGFDPHAAAIDDSSSRSSSRVAI